MLPENWRALIFLLAIALPALHVGRQIAASTISDREFTVWRNAWLASTIAAFLLGSFFLYALALVAVLLYVRSNQVDTVPVFVLLLFVAPPVGVTVGGFGVVNTLLDLNSPRILAALFLVPFLWAGSGRASRWNMADKTVVAFVLLLVFLEYRHAGTTHVLRMGTIHSLDILIPYLAISRSCAKVDDARKVLLAFVVGTLPLAGAGLFEVLKGWHLYNSIPTEWGVPLIHSYLQRDGLLRGVASATQPIAFGFIAMVAIGCLLAIQRSIESRNYTRIAFGILITGLASSLSRGPWLGTVVLLLACAMLRPIRFTSVLKGAAAAAGLLLVLALTPMGPRVLSFLPFVGSVDVENVSYRQRLFDNSLEVIRQNPLLGSVDYLSAPEMQEMVQGQGIVDVVNSYLQIALAFGVVGLCLFVLLILIILIRLAGSLRVAEGSRIDPRALLATLLAIAVTIATVSGIAFIPYVYWAFSGLCVGFLGISRTPATAANRLRTQPSFVRHPHPTSQCGSG